MDQRDLIVTPICIVMIYFIAYMVRSRVTDSVTRRYFIPAITVKIIGAIAIGLIYFFYYGGGDTFSYHTYGSRIIWEAFMESPLDGMKLIFSDGQSHAGIYKYSSRILFFTDPSSFNVVKVAGFLDVFTFSTYSSTALLFAMFSFIGVWLLFDTFYRVYPELHKWIAIACFFIPSVFFWGSGLMKDTLALGSLGFATFATRKIFIERVVSIRAICLLMIGVWGLYAIKIYILLTLIPAAIVWVSMAYLNRIKSFAFKVMMFPFIAIITVGLAYFAALKTGEGNDKYALNKLGETAQITAYDIRYYTGRNAGSGYSIGELDGTFLSMISLAPQAINVTLFRPYLWEVRNPFMLLSAIESLGLFGFTIYVFYKRRLNVFRSLSNPDIFFALIFSIAFAFAVGVSTFNFGTLVRYKIPALPLYFIAMLLMRNWEYPKEQKKVNEMISVDSQL